MGKEEKFIIYLEFTMEAKDILTAEEKATEIKNSWDNQPEDLKLTVRETN